MKTLLALIDFSDVTDAVVAVAMELAAAFKAKLLFVHVAAPEADYEGREMRADVSRQGVAREMHGYHARLQKIERTCLGLGLEAAAMLVRTISIRGNPASKIRQEITRIKPDLILVGSHGHGLLHKVLLGSVSSAVVRKSTVPVVVVPAPGPRPKSRKPAHA